MQPPLFPGRDVHAGTDESLDAMLEEAFRSERMSEPLGENIRVPPDERMIRRVQRKALFAAAPGSRLWRLSC
jgi:hypothetical protein